jgi:ribosomal-protein-alanine N-acetyltransferase
MNRAEEITVRLAGDDDVDAIAWIYGDSFGTERPRDDVTQYLRPDGTWALLATMGDVHAMTPAGFVMARSVLDETEIFSIGVTALYRRRGVGDALMEATRRIAAINGTRSIFLEVGVDNPAARALYLKSGYVVVGSRPNYYRRADGGLVEALILRLILDQGSST